MTAPPDPLPPRVGVTVLLRRPSDGALLFGLRKGHGDGHWGTPGGKLDAGESVTACAARELWEETAIRVAPSALVALPAWTLSRFAPPVPDYVTLWVAGDAPPEAEPRIVEPEKCGGWRWLRAIDEVGPLFGCIADFVQQWGEPWTAARLALDRRHGGDRHCPSCICGKRAPVQGDRGAGPRAEVIKGPGSIAWAEHCEAWSGYAARYGREQSAERIAERGGFGWLELIEYLGREPTTWSPR